MKTLALLITLISILFSCGTNPVQIEGDNIKKTSLDTVVFKLTTLGRWYYTYIYNFDSGTRFKNYINGDFIDPKYKKDHVFSLELTNIIDTASLSINNKIYTEQNIEVYDYKTDVKDTIRVLLLITKGYVEK